MSIIQKRFEVEATLDRTTGGFSLGPKPKEIRPTEADFSIPTEAPERHTDEDVVDHVYKVRQSLFAVMEAEEGLESLRMADFLKSLTNAERQSLYTDIMQQAPNFSWLLCVSPEKEEEVIADISALLAMKDKRTTEFRTQRASLEKKLEEAIGRRYQSRNNARFVRANPHAAVTFSLPDGTQQVADERHYRKQLQS